MAQTPGPWSNFDVHPPATKINTLFLKIQFILAVETCRVFLFHVINQTELEVFKNGENDLNILFVAL